MYEILDARSGKTKQVHFNVLKAASLENVRETIGYDALTGETEEESSEEFPFINEVPTLHAVANAAVPAGTQSAVTAEAAALIQQATDHLAT